MRQLANMLFRLLDIMLLGRFFAKKSNDVESHGIMITKGIKKKRLAEFEYGGYRRVAEIHTFGSKNGEDQILVFQLRGGSSSGGLPQWRNMKISGITEMRILREKFPGRRPAVNHQKWDDKYDMVDE